MIYEFDEFQFEPESARLSRRGVLLHTVPKAMQVLAVLLDGQGSLVDRDTLLNLVWGRVVVTPGTLTRLIAELRRVLGDDPLKPRFIETTPRATAGSPPSRLPGATRAVPGHPNEASSS